MYTISNSQRAEITLLLAAFSQYPTTDIKGYNAARRAKKAIAKLNKAKKL